jgi:hypothetical protein
VRAKCGVAGSVTVRCYNSTAAFKGPYVVTLSGSQVQVQGYGTVDASNTRLGFPLANGQFGAALVFDRSVVVRGTLGPAARATIFAMNDTSTSIQQVPSILIESPGALGSGGAATTAVGLVAQGDIIADPATACSTSIRAAMIAQGGMLSISPEYRGILVSGAPTCGGPFSVLGSITSHFPPYINASSASGGFASGYTGTRSYGYDQNLYHNPPPLFPTSTTYQLLTATTADAACFDGNQTAPRLRDTLGCR